MSKITTKFLFLALVIVGLSGNLFAQMQIPVDIREDIENRLANAQNTIVTDANGRVTQIQIQPVSETTTQVLQLGYDASNRLSTVTDSRGVTVTIQRNESGEVKGFIFPDGGTADLYSKGCVEIDTFNVTRSNVTVESLLYSDGFQSFRGPRGGRTGACRDAVWAIALAGAVCTAGGPLSVACWGATANAAYHTLRCYESTHPNQN